MKKISLALIITLLSGCTSTNDFKDFFKWYGARKYTVNFVKPQSIPAGTIEYTINANPLNKNPEQLNAQKDSILTVLNKNGYVVVSGNKSADYAVTISIKSKGPYTETQSTINPGSQYSTTDTRLQICGYYLDISILNKIANENLVIYNAAWGSVADSYTSSSGGGSWAGALLDGAGKALNHSSITCNDENKFLDAYVQLFGVLLKKQERMDGKYDVYIKGQESKIIPKI